MSEPILELEKQFLPFLENFKSHLNLHHTSNFNRYSGIWKFERTYRHLSNPLPRTIYTFYLINSDNSRFPMISCIFYHRKSTEVLINVMPFTDFNEDGTLVDLTDYNLEKVIEHMSTYYIKDMHRKSKNFFEEQKDIEDKLNIFL